MPRTKQPLALSAPTPGPRTLAPEQRARLAGLLVLLGEVKVANALGYSRLTIAKLAGGLGNHPAIVQQAAARLDEISAAVHP